MKVLPHIARTCPQKPQFRGRTDGGDNIGFAGCAEGDSDYNWHVEGHAGDSRVFQATADLLSIMPSWIPVLVTTLWGSRPCKTGVNIWQGWVLVLQFSSTGLITSGSLLETMLVLLLWGKPM